ncbi:hypothetical protein VCHE16_3774, partial [Vibrio paracholerae HE-16]
MAIAMYTI